MFFSSAYTHILNIFNNMHIDIPLTVIEMPVPIAIIVCEGDLKTVVHIAEALKKNLPVIIMKGSGKAADLVLDYLDK